MKSNSIQYVKGDATGPPRDKPAIIVHICNDVGGWGKGFVLAISKRWTKPEEEYRRWHRERAQPFELGEVQFVEVEPGLWVANLIGQHALKVGADGTPPVRYDAIRAGLAKVARFAREHGATVHMPRIGCGLAGGTWDRIGPIVESELSSNNVPVTVYDL